MEAAAENFRRLGIRNLIPISSEHGLGIGELLDEVFAVLPPASTADSGSEPSPEGGDASPAWTTAPGRSRICRNGQSPQNPWRI